MRLEERPLVFACNGDQLIGVLSSTATPSSRGVLIVVGGPQYRVGSHRQFTLLARFLAENGIPCMRFDYRGMGDSTGMPRNFEQVGDDIRAATDCFTSELPRLREIVLWGLCDAASASIMRAYRDPRVTGLVLLNPWVRTAAGEAKVYLKHYYLKRVVDPAFWHKAIAGGIDLKESFGEVAVALRRATGAMKSGRVSPSNGEPNDPTPALPERMANCLERFSGRVLLMLSGNDLTASEFSDLVTASPRWQRLLAEDRITRIDVVGANHTFASRAWRDLAAAQTLSWIKQWPAERS